MLPAMLRFTNHGESYSVFSDNPEPHTVNPNILLILIDNVQASLRLMGLITGASRDA